MWTHAVLAAKSVRASVTIVGPSIPGFDLEFLKIFLDNANKTDTFPDVVSWHEFGADGSNIPANVEAARNLVSTYVWAWENERTPALPQPLRVYAATLLHVHYDSSLHNTITHHALRYPPSLRADAHGINYALRTFHQYTTFIH